MEGNLTPTSMFSPDIEDERIAVGELTFRLQVSTVKSLVNIKCANVYADGHAIQFCLYIERSCTEK